MKFLQDQTCSPSRIHILNKYWFSKLASTETTNRVSGLATPSKKSVPMIDMLGHKQSWTSLRAHADDRIYLSCTEMPCGPYTNLASFAQTSCLKLARHACISAACSNVTVERKWSNEYRYTDAATIFYNQADVYIYICGDAQATKFSFHTNICRTFSRNSWVRVAYHTRK